MFTAENLSRSLSLRPVDCRNVDEVAFLDGLIQREARWFDFRPALDWHAEGPAQWCFAAVLNSGAEELVVGFGRLSYQSNLSAPVAVATYGVCESHRRRGYGWQILRALERQADSLGLPLLAAVLSENTPGIALARRYFGDALWTGSNDGVKQVVVFGNARARAALTEMRA